MWNSTAAEGFDQPTHGDGLHSYSTSSTSKATPTTDSAPTMLPLPNTSRKRFPNGGYAYSPTPTPLAQHAMSVLRTRTRLTNLAVGLLCSVLGLSLLINLRLAFAPAVHITPWQAAAAKGWDELVNAGTLDSGRPPSVESTIHRDPRMADVDHLVMVPGHAVWTGINPAEAEHDDQWVLQPMQRGGSVKTFIKHVERGAAIAKEDPHALLVFSG